MLEKQFNNQAAVESVLFLASRLKSPTIHEVLKLRYFADKLHMERYGFLASQDDYVAMNFGPVASRTYDILKAARGAQSAFIRDEYKRAVQDAFRVDDDAVIPLRGEDQTLLSSSDIKCMSEVIEREGNKNFGERTERSHDAAWEKAWRRASSSGRKQSEMPLTDIAMTLENAEEVLEYIRS